MKHLKSTLGNESWLRENESKIRDLLPGVWTHAHNINMLKIGFGLKLIGIDWRSQIELVNIMVMLEKLGMILRRNTYQIRAINRSIFG